MSEPVVEMHIEEAAEETADDTTVVVVAPESGSDESHCEHCVDHEGRIAVLEERQTHTDVEVAETAFVADMAQASADAAVNIAVDAAGEAELAEEAAEEAVEEAEEASDDAEDDAPKSKTHWFHRSMSEWKGR